MALVINGIFGNGLPIMHQRYGYIFNTWSTLCVSVLMFVLSVVTVSHGSKFLFSQDRGFVKGDDISSAVDVVLSDLCNFLDGFFLRTFLNCHIFSRWFLPLSPCFTSLHVTYRFMHFCRCV